MELLVDPGFWLALFSVTLLQVALGADNLIIITIIANKLPRADRARAVYWGLILAMLFRLVLLALVSYVLRYATTVFWEIDSVRFGVPVRGAVSAKALVLGLGGLFLIWKGVKELRVKAKGIEQHLGDANRLGEVVALIVGMNLLFSVDSILTVVGMTDVYAVMFGSVIVSVGLMLWFARPIAGFIERNPDFEILGLFVLLLIGFVLTLEGGHVARLSIAGSEFPYVPQWIVIFILVLMFAVDLYQNWFERRREQAPVRLHRRKK